MAYDPFFGIPYLWLFSYINIDLLGVEVTNIFNYKYNGKNK